jgi:hypothetical protein
MPKWKKASRLPGFKPKAERLPQKGLIKASCTVNISVKHTTGGLTLLVYSTILHTFHSASPYKNDREKELN